MNRQPCRDRLAGNLMDLFENQGKRLFVAGVPALPAHGAYAERIGSALAGLGRRPGADRP